MYRVPQEVGKTALSVLQAPKKNTLQQLSGVKQDSFGEEDKADSSGTLALKAEAAVLMKRMDLIFIVNCVGLDINAESHRPICFS
jgi:hypothetical protein